MSARADLATDRVTFTGACPDPAAGFTLLGWLYIEVDLNAFSAIARASAAGTTTFNFATNVDGTTLIIATAGGNVTSPFVPTVGTWVPWAIKQANATTATILAGTDPGSLVSQSGAVLGAANPDQITLFGRSAADGSEWLNGRLGRVRYHSAVLSDAQIVSELRSFDPLVTASLFANWNLATGADLLDTSGNVRHLVAGATALSTPTLEAEPPIAHEVSSTLILGGSVAGAKASAAAVSSGLTLGGSSAGSKAGVGAISSGLTMGGSVTGSAVITGGSPTSAVLCSPWATHEDVSQRVRDTLGGIEDDELDRHLLLASEILWALSGRRWYGGGCTEVATLRSVAPHPGTGTWPYHDSWGTCACWSWGRWVDGRLFPATNLYGMEHHGPPMAVKLPRGPVTAVTSVLIDGNPFTDWRLARAGWVERTDGQGWAMCDDSTVITYQFGEPPPLGGVEAAVALGVEFAKHALGLDGCALPERVTSVTRQGISMTVFDPTELLDKGKTGVLRVDLWLAAVNPTGDPQSAWVWSPDIPSTIVG